jgi:hypothetical protein
MNGQLATSNDTLALERPWIGTFRQRLAFDKTDNLQEAQTGIRNGGRSPAVNLRWYLDFYIGPADAAHASFEDMPKAEPCKSRLPGEKGNIIVPNGESDLRVLLVPSVKDRLNDVFDKKVGLYLVGCVDYTDTSHKGAYRTNFLFRLIPNTITRKIVDITIMPVGNDAY